MKIKPESLRIGNLVDWYGNIILISCVDETQDTLKFSTEFEGWSEINIIDVKPVDLSEKILLKVGFVKSSAYFDYKLNGFEIGYITDDEYFQFETCEKVIDIKYLHQLQNLYFALTGQELNTSGL